MKVYSKMIKVIPIAVLSTSVLFAPVTSFAAEKMSPTTDMSSQTNEIQGYLIKDGIKTPVYKNGLVKNRSIQSTDPAYPLLSSNPDDPVPTKGSVVSENGAVGPVLYFSQFLIKYDNSGPFGDALMENVYLEKKDDGSIQVGLYDPKTLKREPFNNNSLKIKVDPNWKKYFDKTTVTRETAFEKLGSGVVPKTGAYTFSQAVTSGLTTSDAIGGAVTLGYKISFKGGVPGVAEVTEELSAQFTATYNHTITVSSQVTNTQTLSNPKASDTYKYDYYVGAVYQLKSNYKVIPGAELSQDISAGKVKLANNLFQYDDSTLYLAVTPGAAK
ncbi:TPA: hypothetical protein ACQUHP_006478 [Bacillus cereus]